MTVFLKFHERLRCKKNEDYYAFLEACGLKYEKQLQVNLQAVPLETEENPTRLYWQKHHIVPKFIIRDYLKQNVLTLNPSEVDELLIFQESSGNLVTLTEEDHIIAHQMMANIYGDPRDKGAMQLLLGGLSEAKTEWRRAGALATHAKLKAAGRNFWDPEVQKANARTSLLKPDALVTRSIGGKTGGISRNLYRIMKEEDKYLFFYKGRPVLCVFNCRTGGEVIKELNSFIETPIKRISPLLKGQRGSAYGWTVQRITV